MVNTHFLRRFGSCIAGFAASLSIAAERNAEEWILEMHKAVHVRSYSGDLFYQHGRDYMTLRMELDQSIEGDIQTRLVRTDYPSLEVDRRNIRLSYSQDSGTNRVDSDRSFSTIPGLGDWLEHCQTNYKIQKSGKALVAGRNTVIIKIEPHGEDRNQISMWLDERTAIPLRVEIREPVQPHNLLESMSFTNVSIDEVDQDLSRSYDASTTSMHEVTEIETNQSIQVPINAERTQPVAVVDDATKDPCLQTQNNCWRMSYIPEGFSLTSSSSIQTETGSDALMLFHSDGVTKFSIFIQQGVHEPNGTEVIRRGSTLVVSRSKETDDDKLYLISTVGDIPETTAIQITEGISYLD